MLIGYMVSQLFSGLVGYVMWVISRQFRPIPLHACKDNKIGIENAIIKLFYEFGMIIAIRDSIRVIF